jgi:hypothetical protein
MPPRPQLGWKRDPPKRPGEAPDHDAGPLLGTAPPPNRAMNLDLIIDVLGQDSSDCVANAHVQAIRGSHVRQGVLEPELASRRQTYWGSRALHHAADIDDGTYPRSYLDALNRFGFCRESVCPYGRNDVNDVPPWAAFRAASDQRAAGGKVTYKWIQSAERARIDDCKRASAAGFLWTFGTLVSEAFCSEDLPTEPLGPPVGLPIAGGHDLVCVGYEDDDFLILNSWTDEWGENGYCWFKASYIAWMETASILIVEKAPLFSE